MAVAFRAAASADSGSSVTTSVSVTMPAAAEAADLAIACITSSTANDVPSLPAGWTSLRADANADMSIRIAWKRLKPSDLNASIVSTSEVNAVLVIGVLVLSGGDDPVHTSGAFLSAGASTSDMTGPSVTPSVADSMLVALHGMKWNVSPFQRTVSPSAGWTERIEDQANRNNSNAETYVATRLLTGGAGASQTGLTSTASSPQFKGYPSTAVVAPGGPTGSAGDDQADIEPYDTVTLTGFGTGTWAQVSGTSVTLLGSGNTRTFKAPGTIAGETLTFSFGGTQSSVAVLPVTERMVRGGAEVPLEIQQVSS